MSAAEYAEPDVPAAVPVDFVSSAILTEVFIVHFEQGLDFAPAGQDGRIPLDVRVSESGPCVTISRATCQEDKMKQELQKVIAYSQNEKIEDTNHESTVQMAVENASPKGTAKVAIHLQTRTCKLPNDERDTANSPEMDRETKGPCMRKAPHTPCYTPEADGVFLSPSTSYTLDDRIGLAANCVRAQRMR